MERKALEGIRTIMSSSDYIDTVKKCLSRRSNGGYFIASFHNGEYLVGPDVEVRQMKDASSIHQVIDNIDEFCLSSRADMSLARFLYSNGHSRERLLEARESDVLFLLNYWKEDTQDKETEAYLDRYFSQDGVERRVATFRPLLALPEIALLWHATKGYKMPFFVKGMSSEDNGEVSFSITEQLSRDINLISAIGSGMAVNMEHFSPGKEHFSEFSGIHEQSFGVLSLDDNTVCYDSDIC